MTFLQHPGIIMIVFAGLILALPERARKPLALLAPIAALAAYTRLTSASELIYNVSDGLQLSLMEVDRLSMAFLLIFILIAIIDAVYGSDIQDKYEAGMSTLYAGSILSVTLAGDGISFVFFWEVAAFSAAYLIYARHCRKSSQAAFRYILVHAFGGNMLLVGMLMYIHAHGMALQSLTGNQDIAFWFILIGVGVNAVLPPLSSWIVDAYPEATIAGTVYMGGYTTKVGIYALIRLFAGTEFLLPIGVFMALYGVCMALLENDLRRLFCYHIISQLGYMVASLAVGGAFGVDGATDHAFNHILYKGTLLMCAGAVVMATGKRNITELGGLYRKMPLTAICFLIASFAISGVPLLNGFVSKAVIMHAMEAGGHELAFLGLTVASVGTWLSVALKVNYFVFFGKGAGTPEIKQELPITMKIAMCLGAASCAVTGLFPGLVYGISPFQSDAHPFTFSHVAEYLILFAGATAVFWALRSKMSPHEGITLDYDWFYRKPLPALIDGLSGLLSIIFGWCAQLAGNTADYLRVHFGDPYEWTKKSGVGLIRRITFENEEHAIGNVILLACGGLAILVLIAVF